MSKYLIERNNEFQDSIYIAVTPYIDKEDVKYILYMNHTYKLSSSLGINLMDDAIYKYYHNIHTNNKIIQASLGKIPYSKGYVDSMETTSTFSYPYIVFAPYFTLEIYAMSFLMYEKEVRLLFSDSTK